MFATTTPCVYLEDVHFIYGLRWLIIFDLRFTYSSLFSLIWRGGGDLLRHSHREVCVYRCDGWMNAKGNGVSTSTKMNISFQLPSWSRWCCTLVRLLPLDGSTRSTSTARCRSDHPVVIKGNRSSSISLGNHCYINRRMMSKILFCLLILCCGWRCHSRNIWEMLYT